MSKQKLELSEGTLRQRRNLVFISVLLIFMDYAELELGTELKLPWMSATIKNPDVITDFMFLVCVYFLWRFYQYFHVDEAFSHLKSQYRQKREQALDMALSKEIFRSIPQVRSIKGAYKYQDLASKDRLNYKIVVETIQDPETVTKKIAVTIPKFRIQFHRTLQLHYPFHNFQFFCVGRNNK